MTTMQLIMAAAAIFAAWRTGWLAKLLASQPAVPAAPADPADKPLTVAEAKALFADHGLECKRKPPEVIENADGTFTFKPPAK